MSPDALAQRPQLGELAVDSVSKRFHTRRGTVHALDAMTREQLYSDIQEIWQARRKTILLVTHNVREAICLGDRVILFSPRPGRIRDDFTVSLPRPRDINSIEVAGYASRITAALKQYYVPRVDE